MIAVMISVPILIVIEHYCQYDYCCYHHDDYSMTDIMSIIMITNCYHDY